MTSCPWPRQRTLLDQLRQWWTPPKRSKCELGTVNDSTEKYWSTLMEGGFWQS